MSDGLCCIPVCVVPLSHESKAEDFLFFIFQSFRQANAVHTNALILRGHNFFRQKLRFLIRFTCQHPWTVICNICFEISRVRENR
jgi:hypothetical protein